MKLFTTSLRKNALSGMFGAFCAVFAMASAHAESPQDLNDLEIAHVAYVAGNIDIRYAHLAMALSDNPEVRQFAETMLRDHTAVNKAAVALLQKLNVAPQDNFLSQQLLKQADKKIRVMRRKKGEKFDRLYAENELSYHQAVNGAVEGVLIPAAQNAELKALLKSALATFKAHEQHAVNMNIKLGN